MENCTKFMKVKVYCVAHHGVLMVMRLGDVSFLFFLPHSSVLIMEHFFPVKYSETIRHGESD